MGFSQAIREAQPRNRRQRPLLLWSSKENLNQGHIDEPIISPCSPIQSYHSSSSAIRGRLSGQSSEFNGCSSSFSKMRSCAEDDFMGTPLHEQIEVPWLTNNTNAYNFKHSGKEAVISSRDPVTLAITGTNQALDVNKNDTGSSSTGTAYRSCREIQLTISSSEVMDTGASSLHVPGFKCQENSKNIPCRTVSSNNTLQMDNLTRQQTFGFYSCHTDYCYPSQHILKDEATPQGQYLDSKMQQSSDSDWMTQMANIHISTPKPDRCACFDSSHDVLSRRQSISSLDSSYLDSPKSFGFNDDGPDDGPDEGNVTDTSSVHSTQPITNDQKPFACYFPNCPKRFKRLSDVHRHVRKHDTVNIRGIIFTCDICNKTKSYQRKDSIARHRRTCQKKHKKDGKEHKSWQKGYRQSRL